MNREQRFRSAGILFYIVVASMLALTNTGRNMIINSHSQLELAQIVLTAVAAGMVLFTSGPIGFVFGSLPYMFWSIKGGVRPEQGGYATERRYLTYNLKQEVIKRYKTIEKHDSENEMILDKNWMKYGPDVFLSYYWQQAPRVVVEWVSRRQTAYFANMSVAISIIIAAVLASSLIFIYKLGWTANAVTALVVAIVLALLFGHVAQGARIEARQTVDIWIQKGFDKKLNKAMQDMEELLGIRERDS